MNYLWVHDFNKLSFWKYKLLFDFKWAKGRESVFNAHTNEKKFLLIDHDLIINLQSVEKISNECFLFLLFNRLEERKELNNLKEKKPIEISSPN